MKLKVLGSGSSGNCYLLQGDKETLIIECGISYKEILKGLNFNLSNVVGCLISHEHKDHCKAVNDLIKNGINVYGSEGTFSGIEVKENHRIKSIKALEQFKIGEFIVLPFDTQHDSNEPLGFVITHKDMGTLLFATDTYYIQYKFKGINHILVECNYSMGILEDKELPKSLKTRVIKSHFELENVKEFLRATDLNTVKEIMLIHLSDSNSNAAEFKDSIERLTGKPTYIASNDLEIDLE